MSEDQQLEAREIESILALIEQQGRQHRRRRARVAAAVCLLTAGLGILALLWPR